jgi:hypothetical protein
MHIVGHALFSSSMVATRYNNSRAQVRPVMASDRSSLHRDSISESVVAVRGAHCTLHALQHSRCST